VTASGRVPRWRTAAGVDAAYDARRGLTRAAAVLLALPSLEVIAEATVTVPTAFPYVPGLLSFRESPGALAALARLPRRPDLLLVDGHGLAHPRRFGIACHLGLLTGVPAVGVAKSLLVGSHAEPADRRGAWVPLTHRGEEIGAAVRTRPGARPVFVSVGHRIGLRGAITAVLRCTGRYRLPEPIRHADRLSRERPPAPAGA
jgi:deoxyribonuclease V